MLQSSPARGYTEFRAGVDIEYIHPWFRVLQRTKLRPRDPRRLSAPPASPDVDACAHDIEAFGRLISGTQRGEAISGVHSNQLCSKC